MDSIYINQGSFTVGAAVTPVLIPVRSGFNWVKVSNYDAATTNAGYEFYWQQGMTNGSALVKWISAAAVAGVSAAATSMGYITTGGISFLNSSQNTPVLNAVAGTSIAKATHLVTIAGHGYSTGDIVRFTNFSTTAMRQIAGLDFTVTYNDANSFYITAGNINTANVTDAAAGFKTYKIPFGSLFYPPARPIVGFQQALVDTTKTLITFGVTHTYVVGQTVRVNIPPVWGVTISNVQAVITAVGETDSYGYTNTITVQFVYPVGFSWAGTFAWPVVTSLPISYGIVTPIGQASNQTILDASGNPIDPYNTTSAERNTGQLYMVLGTGAAISGAFVATVTGPAGTATSDHIYWQAGQNYLTSSAN